jgi:hypothetical protein
MTANYRKGFETLPSGTVEGLPENLQIQPERVFLSGERPERIELAVTLFNVIKRNCIAQRLQIGFDSRSRFCSPGASKPLSKISGDFRMLTILFSMLLGAYLNARTKVCNSQGIWHLSIDYQQIWQDFLEALQMLKSIWVRTIELGNSTRNYFDSAIAPWLSQSFGVVLTVPTINLPALPISQK